MSKYKTSRDFITYRHVPNGSSLYNLMNKKPAANHIDFADSEYRSFNMLDDATLIIYLNSWDAFPIRIEFTHAIHFLYRLGSGPSNLFEIKNSTELEEILQEQVDFLNQNIQEFEIIGLFKFANKLIRFRDKFIIKFRNFFGLN